MSLLLTLAMTTSAHAEVVRYALVIGANDGGLELETLRYAEGDAGELRDVLVELGGFESSRVDMLPQPRVSDVRGQLEIIQALLQEQEDTLFLFYYSGHADA